MADETQQAIDIHYIKSNAFREAACDGALGGGTPSGKLWIGFYTERNPLPRIVRHQLVPIGPDTFGIDPAEPGTVLDSRAGVVRNLEFGLYLTLDTARQLHEWLGRQLEAAEGKK